MVLDQQYRYSNAFIDRYRFNRCSQAAADLLIFEFESVVKEDLQVDTDL